MSECKPEIYRNLDVNKFALGDCDAATFVFTRVL